MIIRRAMPADWAAFRDIRLTMLSDHPEAFGSTHAEWAAKPEAEIRQWLSDLYLLALFEGDGILGCAAYARHRSAKAAHRAAVISVYVRPEARGQGHADRILVQLAQDARQAGIVQLELEVAVGNSAAIAAYERAGFTRHGVVPRAMWDGGRYIDDLFMVWPLDRA
ncbi:MAG: GNAT family N-acetyltransferase [Roseicyclus sp.]